ncbi:MAG TPA: branched-chain amino acid ABC transporter permease [Geminicoccaceae bacterium]|nr:branched-chain amino acid ABC transporter permease [Geminicoccaceae bacterium]
MLAQIVVSGVAQGALYALVALGMTIVYRATTVVNFGHGDLLMAGAFAVYVFVVYLGLPYPPAALLAAGLMFLLGVAVQRGLIQPILGGPHLALAMMAIAVGYTLRGVARVYWGREVLPFPRIYPDDVFFVGDVVVSADDLIVTGIVLALLAVLFSAFYLTRLGKLAQAVFQSQRGAALVGINVPGFHNVMWGTGALLAAVGGILIAPVTFLYPDMSAWVLIRGFAAMTLGGFGSFHGAVVGGLLLGVLELAVGAYLSTTLVEITAYLVIIGVLLVRPAGLFGRRITVRV